MRFFFKLEIFIILIFIIMILIYDGFMDLRKSKVIVRLIFKKKKLKAGSYSRSYP
jgi:hypothetical protein